MGSKSDYDVVSEAAKVLEKFNVPYELIISSAHRSPKRTSEYVAAAEEKGAQVFIAAAGMAAHLAGAIAANTTRPVVRRLAAWMLYTQPCRCPAACPWAPWRSVKQAR